MKQGDMHDNARENREAVTLKFIPTCNDGETEDRAQTSTQLSFRKIVN